MKQFKWEAEHSNIFNQIKPQTKRSLAIVSIIESDWLSQISFLFRENLKNIANGIWCVNLSNFFSNDSKRMWSEPTDIWFNMDTCFLFRLSKNMLESYKITPENLRYLSAIVGWFFDKNCLECINVFFHRFFVPCKSSSIISHLLQRRRASKFIWNTFVVLNWFILLLD
jgi:hypothetical protein